MKTFTDVRQFFVDNGTPIYYFNTTLFNLIGADEWIGGLQFINTIDSFAGQQAHAFVPADCRTQTLSSLEAANHYLLHHPAVAQFVQAGGKALFLMFDELSEARAKSLGLQVCLPAAALRKHLDSKITTTELANRAGVASVPNVMTYVSSYAEMRRATATLGNDLVVQMPYGDSGNTTFFIANEHDFYLYAERIAAQPVVKIMRRIRCQEFTIEGCVTRHGTLVGPLQTELVGFQELTPYSGGWCGNEVFAAHESALLTPAIRRQAQQIALAMGEQLQQAGYRGCFGLDLLLDQEAGALFLGEMNPRITGATPMTSQVMVEADRVPLLMFHLLEWFDVDYVLDVAAYNQQWLTAVRLSSWSQMILEQTSDKPSVVTTAPESGLWHLHDDGTVRFIRPAFSLGAITDESQALFLRTVNVGQAQNRGASLGRIVLRGRLLTDEYHLHPRAQSWIRGLKAHFETRPVKDAKGVTA